MVKLVSGLCIAFSLVVALVFGVILSAAAGSTARNSEMWQFISVGVILVCIVVFGVSAFLFARKP